MTDKIKAVNPRKVSVILHSILITIYICAMIATGLFWSDFGHTTALWTLIILSTWLVWSVWCGWFKKHPEPLFEASLIIYMLVLHLVVVLGVLGLGWLRRTNYLPTLPNDDEVRILEVERQQLAANTLVLNEADFEAGEQKVGFVNKEVNAATIIEGVLDSMRNPSPSASRSAGATDDQRDIFSNLSNALPPQARSLLTDSDGSLNQASILNGLNQLLTNYPGNPSNAGRGTARGEAKNSSAPSQSISPLLELLRGLGQGQLANLAGHALPRTQNASPPDQPIQPDYIDIEPDTQTVD